MEEKQLSLASEYDNMKQEREGWLSAAKEAAKYTLPSIMPEDTTLTKSRTKSSIKSPNQSVGADGINNLSAKVTLTMLPPNQTFYRFKMDEATLKQIASEQGVDEAEYQEDVNKGLATIESVLLDFMESTSDRVCLGEAMKHLYIAGNVLLVYDKDIGLKYYPLSRYVVKRDYCGNPQKAITEERVGFLELPDYIQEEILNKKEEYKDCTEEQKLEKLSKEEFTLYTCFKKCKRVWKVYQEVEGVQLSKTKGQYPLDICPFIALRYVRVDGESYGRGLVEEYFGDISYLDTISLAIKEASLAGSKCIVLVSPQGQTSIRKLSKAKNGDFVAGKADDVSVLQANKYYDLQTAQQTAEKIERRLNRIFVMKAAIQREAERVTAEEIRQMAADLEEALGNHYSLMAKEFQLAYVKLVYFHLKKQAKYDLPDLIRNKDIKLSITTGLEALGKTSDLNKIITFFDVVAKVAQSAQVAGAKIEPIIKKIEAAMNLDMSDCFYSEEEKAQMQEQAQQQDIMRAATPNLVNKASEMMMKQQEGVSDG